MKPSTTSNEGAPTGPNTLDLKTPEQRAAEKLAAEERAKRAATQGGNTTATVDGMIPSATPTTEAVPVAGNTITMETPRTEPKVVPVPPTSEATSSSSVFKLPEDQVEHKQVVSEQSGGPSLARAESNPAQPETTQPTTEKKPGFFKRLFGGGNKQEPAPQSEQPQNPEQPK